MATSFQSMVTPDGIRDGDAAALAALVERRANGVLAYCEALCPPPVAARAAAEAFARFRAAVAASADPRGLEPEGLLLGATRHAVASLSPVPVPAPAPASGRRRRRGARQPELCAQVPGLLAARAEGSLGLEDQERLARHLVRHAPCRGLADAAEQAEIAYASPPLRTVPIGALTEIMMALAAAAPITAAPGAELVFAHAAPPEAEVELRAEGPDRDLEEHVAPGAAGEQVDDEVVPVAAVPPDAQPGPIGLPDAQPGPIGLPDAQPGIELLRDATDHTRVMPAVPLPATGTVAPAGGVAHPRPQRHSLLPGAPGDHGLLFRYVLPTASVGVALLGAMAVAGVFGGDGEARAPARPLAGSIPAAPPVDAPPVARIDTAADARALAARRSATRAREAAAERRRALIAAAERRRERTAAASPASTPAGTTVPTVVLPEPGPSSPPARTATPAPRPTTMPRQAAPPRPAPSKPATTAEKEPPAQSSSGLPEPEAAPTPSADPGVFEGTPPAAP